jgi:hypothetical protein
MSSKIDPIGFKKIQKIKKNKKKLRKKFLKKNKRHNNFPSQENNAKSKVITNNKLIPYEDFLKINYIGFIFLNIIYLHYETNKVDFCIQSIQTNPVLKDLFNLSYNQFRAKFNTLQIISHDKGKNLALGLSRLARFFSGLTHFFELLPSPFSTVGSAIQFGISEIDKKNKVIKSKNALKFCNTQENFVKTVSLLFSYLLIKDRTDLENLDELVKKNFSIFWRILNKHAQFLENKKSDIPMDIEKFWAYCFGFFALTLYDNSKNSSNTPTIEPIQKNTTYFFKPPRSKISQCRVEANPAMAQPNSVKLISCN